MAGRIRHVSAYEHQLLNSQWAMCSVASGTFDCPEALREANVAWLDIGQPTTAAAALRALGQWSVGGPQRRFDAEDWWFRTKFRTPPSALDEQLILGCGGIATLADVWLDGKHVCASDNMFVAHEWRVDSSIGEHELVIRCRSLDAALQARRPRPRWRAPMIENQQLRWFRTTVLGRTPGWSPAAAPVGPWGDVWLERRRNVTISRVRMRARLESGRGILDFAADVLPHCGSITSCDLSLQRSTRQWQVALQQNADRYSGQLIVDEPELWWPHTHGEPAIYEASLTVHTQAGSTDVALGSSAFRTIDILTDNGDFRVLVNDVPIFCRGACWTPIDPIALACDRGAYAAAFDQIVAAGMNMLRISGTTVYESDAFLDECDRRGILLWHEFMFANMDYPTDDVFLASIRTEIVQQLERLQGRPSLAVLCGNSEVAQQAAMWGADRELWSPEIFHGTVAALCDDICPDTFYWPSSAWGGSFPHQPGQGTCSYYGVGAYLRSIDDARLSAVRFASECLAFANVPESETIRAMPGGLALRVHHPAWKAATPRDLNAGWDFEDVRDHYLRTLVQLDPLQLRYSDHDRYLEFSRVISGEVMAAVFKEWRRAGSSCRGGLIWFLRDLVAGAGWGIIDSRGLPKAAYYIVRRALQSRLVAILDEGMNGLRLHVHNDLAASLHGTVSLKAYKSASLVLESTETIDVPARSSIEIDALALFDGFRDLAFAYRFGPPMADVMLATLSDSDGNEIAEDFYFPCGLPFGIDPEIGLTAEIRSSEQGYAVTVGTTGFAQSVRIEVDGYRPADQYFHLAPGARRVVPLKAIADASPRPIRGIVSALNASNPVSVAIE